ncbi:cryptococcal mannosyltransferase 1-domain-containing protein [Aspergillus unguis]
MHVSDACRSVVHGLYFLIISAARHATRHASRYHKLRRRITQLLLLTLILWSTADVFLVHRHFHEEQIHLDYRPPDRQRIFIASALWDNERTLPSQWSTGVIELANIFGAENIFLSVYASGTSDSTNNALRSLEKTLEAIDVGRRIRIVDSTPEDEVLKGPPADQRRISRVSHLRNSAVHPIYDLRDAGTFFDRILFLSDVAFTKDDVLSLLNTNYNTYTAACSFDMLEPPSDSDAFALRDADGYEHVMQKWPFFRSSRSRDAMKYMLPVPVRSCWGSMVFTGTEAIYSSRPISFRGVPDGLAAKHVVASDTCLVHADNYISRRRGVYLNPFVRVGYSVPARSLDKHWLSTWEIFESIWENRIRRWFSSPFFSGWSVRSRFAGWKAEDEQNKERGDFCLTNEAVTVT